MSASDEQNRLPRLDKTEASPDNNQENAPRADLAEPSSSATTTQPNPSNTTGHQTPAATRSGAAPETSQDPNTVLRKGYLKCSDHAAKDWKRESILIAHGYIKYTMLKGKQATLRFEDIRQVRYVVILVIVTMLLFVFCPF